MIPITIDDHRIEYLGSSPTLNPTPIILLSVIAHFIVYYTIPIPKSMIPSPVQLSNSSIKPNSAVVIRNYIGSTIHATVCWISVSLWYYLFDSDFTIPARAIGGGLINKGDHYMGYLIAYSLGYFIYDSILMAIYPNQLATTSTIIHHIVALFALGFGIYSRVGHCGHFLFLLEEISTPSLNLKTLYKHNSLYRQISEYSFIILFIIGRLIYGSYIYFHLVLCIPAFISLALQSNDWISIYLGVFQFTLCSITRVLNWYWFSLIMKKVIIMIKGDSKSIKTTPAAPAAASATAPLDSDQSIESIALSAAHQRVQSHKLD